MMHFLLKKSQHLNRFGCKLQTNLFFNLVLYACVSSCLFFRIISGIIGALCLIGTLVDVLHSFYKSFYLWSPDNEDDMSRIPHLPLNMDTSENTSPKVNILTPKTKDNLRIITNNCVTIDEESKFLKFILMFLYLFSETDPVV